MRVRSGAPLEYDPNTGAYREVRPRFRIPRLHAILFLLTLLSTYLVGGAAYAFSIIAILLTHEMGHYVMAGYHRIPATLPYFIPFPLNFFGTMGAVIRMDGRRATRKQLFDVGIAGPLAGLVVALPITLIGIRLSEVVPETFEAGGISLGESILFKGLILIAKGALPEASTLLLHPVALAGWVGLFVTALNLLPIGQLDGGHILYGLFGRHASRISLVAFGGIALLALLASPGWLPLVLLLLYFGHRHPPALEEDVSLDIRRRWMGALTLALFFLAFSPVPISYTMP